MINLTLLEWQSFLVDVVKAPIVMVVGRRSIPSEVVTLHSSVVNVGHEVVAYLVSIL